MRLRITDNSVLAQSLSVTSEDNLLVAAWAYAALFVVYGVIHAIDYVRLTGEQKTEYVRGKTDLQNLIAWVLFILSLKIIVNDS